MNDRSNHLGWDIGDVQHETPAGNVMIERFDGTVETIRFATVDGARNAFNLLFKTAETDPSIKSVSWNAA